MKLLNAAGQGTTGASFYLEAPGNNVAAGKYHAYLSGTFGVGASVQIQYSPDMDPKYGGPTDANARWFAPANLLFTGVGDTYFEARFRRIRAVIAGGDGTTSLTLELV